MDILGCVTIIQLLASKTSPLMAQVSGEWTRYKGWSFIIYNMISGLIVWYHGPVPVDYMGLIAKIYKEKKRLKSLNLSLKHLVQIMINSTGKFTVLWTNV